METAREQVRDSVIRQYQGENLSAVGQVFVSDDPGAFLDQLSTMTSYNDLQSQMFAAYTREAKALDIRADATQGRLDEIAAAEKRLASEKAEVDKKLAEAKELLSRLEAEERERMMASRSTAHLAPRRGRLRQRRRRRPVRDGAGRRRLRLRRRRTRRLRLLRPDHGRLGRRRRRAAALLERPVRLRPRTSRPARCSRATWSSTTARSATSACTSATA